MTARRSFNKFMMYFLVEQLIQPASDSLKVFNQTRLNQLTTIARLAGVTFKSHAQLRLVITKIILEKYTKNSNIYLIEKYKSPYWELGSRVDKKTKLPKKIIRLTISGVRPHPAIQGIEWADRVYHVLPELAIFMKQPIPKQESVPANSELGMFLSLLRKEAGELWDKE